MFPGTLRWPAVCLWLVSTLGLPVSGAPPIRLAPQEAFRAAIDYITFQIRVLDKRKKTPRLGLRLEDFTMKVDGRKRAIARLEIVGEGTPSHAYLLALQPAPGDRDGKPHTMEVQVKGIGQVAKRTFRIDGRKPTPGIGFL